MVCAQKEGGSPWSTFRHDNQGTARSSASGPESGDILWSASLSEGRTSNCAPVAGMDGTIYVGTWGAQRGVLADHGRGRLFAVSPQGKEKWRLETGGAIWSACAIGRDGAVYYGDRAGTVGAVRDEGQDGKILWRFSKTGHWFDHLSLADDGTLYAAGAFIEGFKKQRASLVALRNGKEKWVMHAGPAGTLEHWVSCMGLAGDGTIYMGTQSIQVEAAKYPDFGKLYALADRGDRVEVKWTLNAGSGISGIAIDRNGVIYYSVRGDRSKGVPGTIHAVGPDGKSRWKHPAAVEGELWWGGNPALVEGRLYVSTAASADISNLFPSKLVPRLYAIGRHP
ncbi:MAG: PQQ-binding-like beta-propeller repeat protein [Candidatus Eremiobacteraeota bacterium]|nr:PQQ-binding-like beta-propeller repeat protein [Candidatus Eremiobacteraeota bacterium]